MKHSPVTVLVFFDNNHTVQFTTKKYVMKEDQYMVCVGKRVDGICSVDALRASDEAIATLEVEGYML